MSPIAPLAGLKVIETSSVLAGPAVGMFLAELGAEVIKIENRTTGGDVTRSWKLRTEEPDSPVCAYFSSVNYRKSYLDLDLRKATDRQDLIGLVRDADILINNMKASSAKEFGLDHDSLSRLNPRLIHVELTGFAGGNPKVGFDVVLQAETGFLSMTGSKEAGAKLPVALIDIMAAHQMKEAILLALYLREKDGKGAHIRSSLEEASLASLANQASNYLMQGFVPGRMGTLHPNIAPYGEIVRTSDGVQFVLAIGSQSQFQRFCILLGLDDLSIDPRFIDNQTRVKHRIELLASIQQKVQQKDSLAFERSCDELKIPIGRIRTLDEVLESPVAKDMVLEETIEGVRTKRIRTVAFHMER